MKFIMEKIKTSLKASDSPRPFGPAELVFKNIFIFSIINFILPALWLSFFNSVAFFAHHAVLFASSGDFYFARWDYFSTQLGFSFCANGNDQYLCEVE